MNTTSNNLNLKLTRNQQCRVTVLRAAYHKRVVFGDFLKLQISPSTSTSSSSSSVETHSLIFISLAASSQAASSPRPSSLASSSVGARSVDRWKASPTGMPPLVVKMIGNLKISPPRR